MWFLLLNNVIAFLIMKLFLKMLDQKTSKKTNIYFLIFIIALTPLALALSYLLIFRFLEIETIANYICIFILIFLTFICDYFSYRQAIILEKQLKLEITNSLSRQFYLDILQKSIKLKEDNANYRAIRHDLINYIERIKLEKKKKEEV